jgi:hypothetical protein
VTGPWSKAQAAGDARSISFVTDLSRRWRDIPRLPFVFARWVVRKDASDVGQSGHFSAGWTNSRPVKPIPGGTGCAGINAAAIEDTRCRPTLFQGHPAVPGRTDIRGQERFSSKWSGLAKPLFRARRKYFNSREN